MEQYAGIDGSVDSARVCAVDATGRIAPGEAGKRTHALIRVLGVRWRGSAGDGAVRPALYEPANIILARPVIDDRSISSFDDR